MSENPFEPYDEAWKALRAVIRFGPALVEYPGDFLALLFVAERTAGWQKASDAVSLHQFVAGIRSKDGAVIRSGCGLQLATVKRALARLDKGGVLVRERRHGKRAAYVATNSRSIGNVSPN